MPVIVSYGVSFALWELSWINSCVLAPAVDDFSYAALSNVHHNFFDFARIFRKLEGCSCSLTWPTYEQFHCLVQRVYQNSPLGSWFFWNLLILSPTVGQLQDTISSWGMCVLCSAFFSHPFSATQKSIWQTSLCSDLSLSSSLRAICSIFVGLWWFTRGLLCFPHEPHFSQLDCFGVAFLAFLPYVLQTLAGLNQSFSLVFPCVALFLPFWSPKCSFQYPLAEVSLGNRW